MKNAATFLVSLAVLAGCDLLAPAADRPPPPELDYAAELWTEGTNRVSTFVTVTMTNPGPDTVRFELRTCPVAPVIRDGEPPDGKVVWDFDRDTDWDHFVCTLRGWPYELAPGESETVDGGLVNPIVGQEDLAEGEYFIEVEVWRLADLEPMAVVSVGWATLYPWHW